MSRLGSGAVSQQPVRRQGCLIFARGHCPEEMCRVQTGAGASKVRSLKFSAIRHSHCRTPSGHFMNFHAIINGMEIKAKWL